MRAEKEPTTGSRERAVVEIQLRDAQREQDSVTASLKHKEEKKEIFTKVGQRTTLTLLVLTLRRPVRDERFSTTDSAPGAPQDLGSSKHTNHLMFHDFVQVCKIK